MSNLCLSTLTPQSPITIDTSEESITLSVDDVLKWLAPNAPRQEAFRFLLICRSARVNPFLGEAHLVPHGSRWTVIIDKSGWLRRAEEHPAFDGHESGIIVQRVDLKTKPPERISDPYDIDGACIPPSHVVVGGWAKVYRKDRRVPTVNKVSLIEYQADSPTWKRLTSTMLRKTALIHALRESGLCFGLGGAYDRDEMPPLAPQVDPGPVEEAVEIEYRATPMPSLTPALAIELMQATRTLLMTDYQVAAMLSKRGARTIAELTDAQAQDLIGKLHAKIDELQAGETLLPDSQDIAEDVAENKETQEEAVSDADAVVAEALVGLAEGIQELSETADAAIADALRDDEDQVASPVVTNLDVPAPAFDFGIAEATDDSEVADVERPAAKAVVKRSKKKATTA